MSLTQARSWSCRKFVGASIVKDITRPSGHSDHVPLRPTCRGTPRVGEFVHDHVVDQARGELQRRSVDVDATRIFGPSPPVAEVTHDDFDFGDTNSFGPGSTTRPSRLQP